VRVALQGLAQAGRSLRANPQGSVLSLAILPAFGMHWLAPRLAGFARAHPQVSVNLSTRLRPFDFAAEPFDAAIHFGRQDWPGAEYLPLMPEQVLAVAAPGVVRAPVAQAADVLAYPLLQIEGRSGDWGRWLAAQGVPGQRPPGMVFDQFATLMQGAIHGLGLALLPLFLIEADLAAGRLVPVFGGPMPSHGSYHLVWPADRPARPPLLAFRDWIAEAAAQPKISFAAATPDA